jgi:hypothetical protein
MGGAIDGVDSVEKKLQLLGTESLFPCTPARNYLKKLRSWSFIID